MTFHQLNTTQRDDNLLLTPNSVDWNHISVHAAGYMVSTWLGLCTRQIHAARQTDNRGNYLAHSHAQCEWWSTCFRGIYTHSAIIRIGYSFYEITRKFSFLKEKNGISEFTLLLSSFDKFDYMFYLKYSWNWFQTFALFWILYAFFWVIPRRMNFICHRFGTLSVPSS